MMFSVMQPNGVAASMGISNGLLSQCTCLHNWSTIFFWVFLPKENLLFLFFLIFFSFSRLWDFTSVDVMLSWSFSVQAHGPNILTLKVISRHHIEKRTISLHRASD